jgi:energy-coupling factor transporter ATP-binding protein EcfA2
VYFSINVKTNPGGNEMLADSKRYRHHSTFSINKQKEIEDYVAEILETKDNYLVGQIDRNVTTKNNSNFFLISNLMNPFTGKKVGKIVEGAPPTLDAICRNSRYDDEDLGLKKDEIVLFKFTIDIYTITDLGRGNLLSVDKESITPIREGSTLLDRLKITIDDLGITGIMDILGKNNAKFYFSNDIYKEIIKEKIDQEASKLVQVEQDIEGKREQLENERNAFEEEKKSIEKFRKEVKDLNKQLKAIGFPIFIEGERQGEGQKVKNLETPQNERDLIKGIQRQIAREGLYYDEDTIRRFYAALKTNQFIILSGPSGTGKTSLISAFSKIISAKPKVIPVQPSWMDKQDLLGFYNPMRKRYVPSVFLDALMDAKNNPDQLHIICLDELNLAQIEYYLADILSIREQKEPKLELYSQYEYDQAMEEIRWYIQKVYHAEVEKIEDWIQDTLGVEKEEQINFIQRYQNLKRYPASFVLPKNVRLIGTMNVDGTVRPLSPKVIDRSFMIELIKQEEKVQPATEEGAYNLPLSMLELAQVKPSTVKYSTYLDDLQSNIRALKANYNNRVEKHLDLYALAVESFGVDDKGLADELFAMKILPRIHYLLDGSNIEKEIRKDIKKVFGDDSMSFNKVDQMLTASNKTKIFSYWC